MLKRSRIYLVGPVIALALAATAMAQAPAQGGAPQVDPNSPAGTEYQLPIDRARTQASGGGSRSAPAGTAGAAPLFGEGVERTRAERRKARSTAPARAGVQRDRDTGTSPTIRAQAATPSGSGGWLVAVGAGAASVLVLGALGGRLWRRRGT